MRVKIVGDTESSRVIRAYLVKAGIAVSERLPKFALSCTIHLSEHSGPSIIVDSIDSPLEMHILRHITELSKKDITLRRGTESPAIVSSANEIHISIPAGEPELAHAVEVGVLRGVQRAHFHRPWYRRLLPVVTFALLLPTLASAQYQTSNTVTRPFSGVPSGSCNSFQFAVDTTNGDFYNCLFSAWHKISSGGGASSFDLLTTGVNVTATMTVGSGATLTFSGTGVNNASQINGVAVNNTPATGQIAIATSPTTAVWADPVVSGPDANAAVPSGSPIVTAGWDGTNVRRYKTDSTGVLQINQTGGSVTLNTTSPLTGGGTVAFGGALTFACPTCVTSSLTNPMTTLGDIIYGASSGTPTRLPANSTGTLNFLTSLSNAVPVWTPATIANIGAGTSSANYTLSGNLTAIAGQNIFDLYNLNNTILLDGSKYPVSGSASNTTGSITSGQPTLTLASALDFKNGQGIMVIGAGAAVGAITPSAITVTPCTGAGAGTCPGGTGATTYQYQLVAIDAFGAMTAPTTATVISNGNAALTFQTYNKITFTGVAGNFAIAVYGRTSGAMNFLGMAWCGNATQCFFYDTGAAHSTPPASIPSTVPAGARNGYFVTSITSGAGTTTLTLAANATATVSSAAVYHDDGAAINSAIQDAVALGGTTVVFPPGTYYVDSPNNSPPFNRDLFYCSNCSNLRITGSGSGTVLTTLHPQITMFEFFGGQAWEVDHIKISQPSGGHMDMGSDTSGSAIRLSGSVASHIHDVEVAGGASIGIWISGGTIWSSVGPNNVLHDISQAGIAEDNCNYGNVTNGCGANAVSLGNSIFNNTFIAIGEPNNPQTTGVATGQAIATDDGANAVYLTIADNFIYNAVPGNFNFSWSCIKVGNSSYVTVTGNTCKQPDQAGILISTGGSSVVSQIVVSGNNVINSGSPCFQLGSGTGLTYVISLVDIIGNICTSPVTWGLTVDADAANIKDLNIIGNVFQNVSSLATNTYDAITAKGSHINIDSNMIDGNAKTRNGIFVDTTSTFVQIGGNNHIWNTASAAVSDTGAIASTTLVGKQIFPAGSVLPAAAGGTDIGATALPFGNLWLGTAATNNFKFQPAATAAARVISMPDPLGAVNMPYVIASGTSAMTTAGVTTGACGTTVTTAATGALTTDAVEISRNAAATNANGGNLILNYWVTAGNINLNYCNPGAATVTPTAMTVNWRVIR